MCLYFSWTHCGGGHFGENFFNGTVWQYIPAPGLPLIPSGRNIDGAFLVKIIEFTWRTI